MDKGRVSKFFKVTVNNQVHKVFLDDVTAIYKRNAKRTPPLIPDFSPSRPSHDQSQTNINQKTKSVLVASQTYG